MTNHDKTPQELKQIADQALQERQDFLDTVTPPLSIEEQRELDTLALAALSAQADHYEARAREEGSNEQRRAS